MATVLGISIAVGALLVLATLPAATSAVRLQRQAALTASDASCEVGSGPQYVGYDTANRDTYVPNFDSGTITVLSGTCDVVSTIDLPGGAEPVQALFDPQTNYVYVTDYALDQIYEISGTKLVSTITQAEVGFVFDAPWGIAYNPYSQCSGTPLCPTLFVANEATNTVALIYPTMPGASADITVGSNPQAVAFDPQDNQLWVVNSGSDNVTLLTLPSAAVPYTEWYSEISLPVGSDPRGIDFDLANGAAYVANFGSNNVTVYSASDFELPPLVLGSISGIKEPVDVAWDQSTGYVYVTSFGTDKVWVLGGSSGLSDIKKETMSVAGVNGICYDAAIGKMYVTGFLDGYAEVTS